MVRIINKIVKTIKQIVKTIKQIVKTIMDNNSTMTPTGMVPLNFG